MAPPSKQLSLPSIRTSKPCYKANFVEFFCILATGRVAAPSSVSPSAFVIKFGA